jgi:hypothetical protein
MDPRRLEDAVGKSPGWGKRERNPREREGNAGNERGRNEQAQASRFEQFRYDKWGRN